MIHARPISSYLQATKEVGFLDSLSSRFPSALRHLMSLVQAARSIGEGILGGSLTVVRGGRDIERLVMRRDLLGKWPSASGQLLLVAFPLLFVEGWTRGKKGSHN